MFRRPMHTLTASGQMKPPGDPIGLRGEHRRICDRNTEKLTTIRSKALAPASQDASDSRMTVKIYNTVNVINCFHTIMIVLLLNKTSLQIVRFIHIKLLKSPFHCYDYRQNLHYVIFRRNLLTVQ